MPSLSLKQETKIKVLSKAIKLIHLPNTWVPSTYFYSKESTTRSSRLTFLSYGGGMSGSSWPNKGINTLGKWRGNGLLWVTLKWYNCIEHLCKHQSGIEAIHINQHQNILKYSRVSMKHFKNDILQPTCFSVSSISISQKSLQVASVF